MKKIFLSLLDLIYRKKCYFCSSSKYSLKMCPECFDSLSYLNFYPLKIIDGVNVYICGTYDKNLQKLIRGLKYHKQKELAFFLAKFMYNYWQRIEHAENFQVVPTPLHVNRIKKRKYNHMELVAEEFCRFTGYSLNNHLIKRVKDTKPQYRLSKKERAVNLSNAFEVDTFKDLGLPVLLLDDICTTGSTFEEMIKTCRTVGITDIVCLAASSP